MLCPHCRAIRYERHDCQFLAECGISLKFPTWILRDEGRYVHLRFVELERHINYDCLISGDPICHEIDSRLDKISYI